jgi:DNA-binding MarR family transcriptional regulator
VSIPENLEERHARLEHGFRLRALSNALREMIEARRLGDEQSNAVAMLIIDATLDGDEASLHAASRQLQFLYRALTKEDTRDRSVLEDRGRVLAFLDAAGWGLERTLALDVVAELEQHSAAHEFLRAVSDSPGMTNTDIAKEIGISAAEVSRLGRRLADSSLAAKRRLGRRNHWEITPKGLQALDILRAGSVSRFRRPHLQTH